MKRVVISGWYGEKNLGDEIILESMINTLENNIEEVEITVLSFNPQYTKETQNVSAVRHFPYSLKSLVGRLLRNQIGTIFDAYSAVKKADVILIGGGGFLSDWNPEAIKPWLRQIHFFKTIMKKDIMLYAIGAGPFIHNKYKKKVNRALKLVDYVTVRDKESYDQLSKCGVSKQIITADPVVDLPINKYNYNVQGKFKVRIGLSIAPLFMSNLWKNSHEKYNNYLNAFVEFINLVNENTNGGYELVFIPMQDNYDRKFNEEIISKVKIKENISILPDGLTNLEKISYIRNTDLMIGMRLHSIIIASTFSIPSLGVVYHHKGYEYLKSIRLENLSVEVGDGDNWKDTDIDPKDMYEKFIKLTSNLSYYNLLVKDSVNILKEKNKVNISKVKNMLKE